MPNKKGSDGRVSGGQRQLFTKVKTARGRKGSSTRWLQRQLNDPYVELAKKEGYRTRAAFKLLEIDDKFDILGKGKVIVDLGAAPGGWTQVSVKRHATVIGMDLQEIEPIPGATLIQHDFTDDTALDLLHDALSGQPVDVVLSDMAAAATGHTQTDHLRIMGLCEMAYDFAKDVLAPGGAFVAKILRGGTEQTLLTEMKQRFDTVRHFKPPSSRSDSAEMFVVAKGFRKQDD